MAELIDRRFGDGGRGKLAEKCGLPLQSVSRYTRSDDELRRASYATVERIADALGVRNPRGLFGPVREEINEGPTGKNSED
ncbi:helix-turn-helix domain-containing protein [Bifidobacterium cuniculi]|uniref:helix-turn-helix domain-containing protein n=1 Tax=Bifidobacterium cuniculi TaxID=1688 RepID=UPI0012E00FDC|nr:helix-turn-helix transcriptional regulator [Bifidobacterium cuniculi]